ncbi:MAG: dihydrofolate reductase [Candidatus Zambryskibacteria bacterium]|nr:dihydrofolate reductase [Candidatus Zambryskibacteria bacterium]
MKATTIEKALKISVIVAVTKGNNAIGKDTGELLFRISDDLKRFKALTMGHPVIMGRKTHESIGKALPGRTNIVITRNPNFRAEGCVVVSSMEEAIKKSGKTDKEVFVIGGGEIYKQAFPYAERLYLTIVESNAEGNVYFPNWKKDFTKEIFREERFDEKTGLKYAWITLER